MLIRGRGASSTPGAMLVLCAALLLPVSPAAGQSCTRAEFEAVVDDAAGALRDLNQSNKPSFQEKLRLLRDKRAWSHDQFLKEAVPFVQDDTIADFDRRSADLLGRITSMGQEGSTAKAPDCALLLELRGHMKSLVDVQQAKWTYMFAKLDTELAK